MIEGTEILGRETVREDINNLADERCRISCNQQVINIHKEINSEIPVNKNKKRDITLGVEKTKREGLKAIKVVVMLTYMNEPRGINKA